MVIAYLCGGLGNQMFQFATARRLAQVRGVELRLDLSEYRGGTDQRPAGLEAFRRRVGVFDLSITASEATAADIERVKDPYTTNTTVARVVRRLRRIVPNLLRPASHVVEKQYRFDPEILELGSDVYLHGFWQSEKYFVDAAPLIRAEFAPRDAAIGRYAGEYVAERRGGGHIVSLHVRRGDLAAAHESLGKGHIVHGKPISLEYISAAIARFPEDHRFLVFSDSAKDIDWCRANLRGDGIPAERLLFSEGHTDIQDMAIMSACDHHIIANSTFSWWAAWLDAKPVKRVIAPAVWSAPGAKFAMVTDDLIPREWEMI
jgi:hypothetical protein